MNQVSPRQPYCPKSPWSAHRELDSTSFIIISSAGVLHLVSDKYLSPSPPLSATTTVVPPPFPSGPPTSECEQPLIDSPESWTQLQRDSDATGRTMRARTALLVALIAVGGWQVHDV